MYEFNVFIGILVLINCIYFSNVTSTYYMEMKQHIYSVTRVPGTYQRRPGNGENSPARNHRGLIGPSWGCSGEGYKSLNNTESGGGGKRLQKAAD